MRASLPMYDLPALRAAHGRFWSLLRGRLVDAGIDAPVALTPDGIGPAFWTAPDLVFSQTCGMPYRTQLLGKVQLVGTPDYGLPGCPPGYYASHLIKRQEDSRQTLADFAGDALGENAANQHKRVFLSAGALVAVGGVLGLAPKLVEAALRFLLALLLAPELLDALQRDPISALVEHSGTQERGARGGGRASSD